MTAETPARVAVLFDYWNAKQGAKQAIGRWQAQGRPPQMAGTLDGHFNPVLLAVSLSWDATPPADGCARRNRFGGAFF